MRTPHTKTRTPALWAERLEERTTPDVTGVGALCNCPNLDPENDPPVANPDTFKETTVGTMLLDVLGNDSDPDGDQLFLIDITQPINGNVSIAPDGLSIEYSPPANFEGTETFEYTVADGFGGESTARVTLGVSGPTSISQYAVGAGQGGPSTVTVHNPDGSEAYTVDVFPGFTGGVRTAMADVNGDGTPDLITGTGPGGPTQVRVFNGTDQSELFRVAPFEESFTGGVYVAAGDVTGDGQADIAISPDRGGGPRIRLFSGADFSQLIDFFGIDDPAFRGGARSALGDLNRDGVADLVVAAGFLGGPRVALFDGTTLRSEGEPQKLIPDFFAFEQTLRNGLFPGAGDVDGDGQADLIAGGGPGGAPRVLILSGSELLAGNVEAEIGNPVANFFAGNIENRGGIRVEAKDFDGDTQADLVAGSGTEAEPRVTRYAGADLPAAEPPEMDSFLAFDASFTGGVFVG